MHFTHEEAPGWTELVEALQVLPGFDTKWFAKVGQPPFEELGTVAFERR